MQKNALHILLADDDEDDRMFFTDAFDELKMKTKVQTYNDGVELMNYLMTENAILPHVLFLDLNMPKKMLFLLTWDVGLWWMKWL